jgi:hypothetical protein
MNSSNRKIKNARATGAYKSALEQYTADLLLPMGFRYEPKKYIIYQCVRLPATIQYYHGKKDLSLDTKKFIDITYTPDFVREGKNTNIIVECKGYRNDMYFYKLKMLLVGLAKMQVEGGDKKIVFLEVKNKRQLDDALEIINRIVNQENDEDDEL